MYECIVDWNLSLLVGFDELLCWWCGCNSGSIQGIMAVVQWEVILSVFYFLFYRCSIWMGIKNSDPLPYKNPIFICPSKMGLIMRTPMVGRFPGGRCPQWCPLNNSNSCWLHLMKLGENVYGHNISAKFDNQLNHFSHLRVVALYW
jgi:hypothetical protein